MGSSNSTENVNNSTSIKSIRMHDGQTEMAIITPGTNDYLYIKYEEVKLINIKVQAETDAYIALTFSPDFPLYEVLIGTSRNTKTIIYFKRRVVAEVSTKYIISPREYREFWLSWDKKTITLGHKGNPQGIISYKDPHTITDRNLNLVGLKTCRCYGNWKISVGPEKRRVQTVNASFMTRYQPEDTKRGNSVHINSIKSQFDLDLIALLNKQINRGSASTCQSNFPKQNAEESERPKLVGCNLKSSLQYSTLSNNKFQENRCREKQNSNKLVNNGLNPDMNIYTNTCIIVKGDTNKQSDKNGKFIKRSCSDNNKRKENTTKTFNNQKQSKSNEINENLKTIIPRYRLEKISSMSAEMIICELRNVKFEMLLEATLTRSYLNLITKIISKLCKARFTDRIQSFIYDLFLKETFIKQLLKYINKIPFETEAYYEKYKRFTTELWLSLYDICREAWSCEKHLENRLWLNVTSDCYGSLFILVMKDESLTEIKDLFLELKGNIDDEMRLKGNVL